MYLVAEKKNEAIKEIKKNFSSKQKELTAYTSRSIGQKRTLEEYSQQLKAMDTGSAKTSFVEKADFVVQSKSAVNSIQASCRLDTRGNRSVCTKLRLVNEEEASTEVVGLEEVVTKLRKTSYSILKRFLCLL